jgi:hypothetical protein
LRGSGKDTVKAARAEVTRDQAHGTGRDTAERKQSTLSDRAVRKSVRVEPHLYPPVEEE